MSAQPPSWMLAMERSAKADDKVVLGSEFELLVADDKVVQFLCAGTIAPILMRSFSQNDYGRV